MERMANPGWDPLFDADRTRLRMRNLARHRRVVRALDSTHAEADGRVLINFCSNNYLGLTHDPRVIETMRSATAALGAGSAASGLIAGHSPAHVSAEAAIARWKGCEAAVLVPSGYQANHAAVQTIAAVTRDAGRPVRALLDKLCHASIIDAVRAAEVPMRVFPHNNLDKLRRLLSDADSDELQVVVTESIFSMDGDPADLPGIVRLKRDRPFLLIVDEAHGGGVYGPGGAGLASELGLAGDVDVTIATFSKAAGVVGGAVCGSQAFIDAVSSRGRAYVYTTSVPPAVAAGVEAAIGIMSHEPYHQRRVRALARHVRSRLAAEGHTLPPGDSPIIPFVVGDEASALAAADRLFEQGFLVVAVRPPTVTRGSSRLRVTLSAAHTDDEVDSLIAALLRVRL